MCDDDLDLALAWRVELMIGREAAAHERGTAAHDGSDGMRWNVGRRTTGGNLLRGRRD